MDLQIVGDNILLVAVYATLLLRLRYRFNLRWDILAAVVGAFGAILSVARNVEAGISWPEIVLVAVLVLLMPFALMSSLIAINLGLQWGARWMVQRTNPAREGEAGPAPSNLLLGHDEESWHRKLGFRRR
jgi:hypothetical protein